MRVALMVLDSLEFVHSKGYAHNDIKVRELNSQLFRLAGDFYHFLFTGPELAAGKRRKGENLPG